jgi:hypothetical protein
MLPRILLQEAILEKFVDCSSCVVDRDETAQGVDMFLFCH